MFAVLLVLLLLLLLLLLRGCLCCDGADAEEEDEEEEEEEEEEEDAGTPAGTDDPKENGWALGFNPDPDPVVGCVFWGAWVVVLVAGVEPGDPCTPRPAFAVSPCCPPAD